MLRTAARSDDDNDDAEYIYDNDNSDTTADSNRCLPSKRPNWTLGFLPKTAIGTPSRHLPHQERPLRDHTLRSTGPTRKAKLPGSSPSLLLEE